MVDRTRPRVRADVFPAVITLAPPDSPQRATNQGRPPEDHRRLDKCRVVVTLDQVLIFQDASGGPQLIFSERLASYTAPPPTRSLTIRSQGQFREATATTDSGKTLSFARQGGCGCGSRLRSFDPFSATYSTQAPLQASTKDS
jgi:hypothetical protein